MSTFFLQNKEKKFLKRVKLMNFNELLDTLQKLKSGYKINQMSIANILGLSRQTMSKRFQIGTEVTVSELQEIENFYNVSLYKNQTNTFEPKDNEQVLKNFEHFGARLNELQGELGYLDKAMARIMGTDEKRYMRIKLGKEHATAQELARLASKVDVSIDWLMFGE